MIKEKFNFIIEKIKNSNTKQRIIAGGVALGLVLGIVGISVGVNLHSQKVANGGLTNKQLKKAVAAEQKATNSIDTEEYKKLVKEDVESKTASMTEEEKKEVEKKVEENGGNKDNPIDVSNAIAEVKPEETPAKEEEKVIPQPSEPVQVEQQPSQPEQQPNQPSQQPSQKPQEETPKPQPEPEKPKPNNPSAGTYNAEMSSWLNQVLINNGLEETNTYGMDDFISSVDRGEVPAAGTIKVDPISGEMNGSTAVVGPYYFNTKPEDYQYWADVFHSSLYHDSLYVHAVRVRVFNDGNGGWYVNAYYMTFE